MWGDSGVFNAVRRYKVYPYEERFTYAAKGQTYMKETDTVLALSVPVRVSDITQRDPEDSFLPNKSGKYVQ